MRYLRIASPTVTLPAKQGNAGLYTCRFCYAVSIGQFINKEFCQDQSTHVNVIGIEIKSAINNNCSIVGISPMIDRTVAAPGGIVIGTTICLDEDSDEVLITCSQNSTNQPELEPKATFLIDGQQQPDITIKNPVIELPRIGDTVLILLLALRNQEPHTITCFLNNTFGSDMETSLILQSKFNIFAKYIIMLIQQIPLSYHLLVPFNVLYQMVVMELNQVMSYVLVKVKQLI